MKRLSRWTAVVLLPAFILLFSLSIFAQQWDSSVAEKGVDGIANVASSIIADSFVPMTHYNHEDLVITLVPAYFDIQKAYDDPEVGGKDLTGYSAALGAGYALSDRCMAYGVLAHMNIKGDMEGKFYPELSNEKYRLKTDYSLTALYGGMGFDLLGDNSTLSIPIYAGVFVERYDVSLSLPEESGYRVTADDTGYLYGGSLAVALSWKIMEMFKLTPYYLYSISFNKPEITAKASTSVPFPYTKSQTMTMDRVNAGMAGLALTWMTTDAFSVSVSLGGWLTSQTGWYNEKFLDGLEMKSIVVALSYTGK
jgi:hypothetical protein